MPGYPPASSREWDAIGESYSPQRQEEKDDKYLGGVRVTPFGRGVAREEQAKPKMRLVQIPRDGKSQDKSDEEKVSQMQSLMRGWYGCDCC